VADLGLSTILIRDVSRQKELTKEYVEIQNNTDWSREGPVLYGR